MMIGYPGELSENQAHTHIAGIRSWYHPWKRVTGIGYIKNKIRGSARHILRATVQINFQTPEIEWPTDI